MEPGIIASVATVLSALSVASERLVEIIKGFVPYLNTKIEDDDKKENRRKAAIQILAIFTGIASAYLTSDALKGLLPGTWWEKNENLSILALGVLASGGSGLWNSVLGYANELKKVKKLQAEEMNKRLAAA